jgi:hypothetical protein
MMKMGLNRDFETILKLTDSAKRSPGVHTSSRAAVIQLDCFCIWLHAPLCRICKGSCLNSNLRFWDPGEVGKMLKGSCTSLHLPLQIFQG